METKKLSKLLPKRIRTKTSSPSYIRKLGEMKRKKGERSANN